MARPIKKGLDYFELDCQLDDEIKLIQAQFGLKGFAIVVKLYQKIYGGCGYYCEWDEDRLLLFMAENGLASDSKNLIRDIVAACIKRDIFSEKLFNEFGILTSTGIQKRYLNATSKRKRVELKKEYLLLSVGKNNNNVYINSINDVKNSVNVCSNSQSREEKSRVINNIVATPDGPGTATVTFTEQSFEILCVNRLIKSCLESFPKSKVPSDLIEKQKWAIEIDRMKRLDKRSEEEILRALDYAVTDSFWKSNIRSAKKFREKFETLYLQSKNKKSGKKAGTFNNFGQREYDFDELERKCAAME